MFKKFINFIAFNTNSFEFSLKNLLKLKDDLSSKEFLYFITLLLSLPIIFIVHLFIVVNVIFSMTSLIYIIIPIFIIAPILVCKSYDLSIPQEELSKLKIILSSTARSSLLSILTMLSLILAIFLPILALFFSCIIIPFFIFYGLLLCNLIRRRCMSSSNKKLFTIFKTIVIIRIIYEVFMYIIVFAITSLSNDIIFVDNMISLFDYQIPSIFNFLFFIFCIFIIIVLSKDKKTDVSF